MVSGNFVLLILEHIQTTHPDVLRFFSVATSCYFLLVIVSWLYSGRGTRESPCVLGKIRVESSTFNVR